ncbi:hypothetical protein ZWY2020_043761 [Hordeum vulgare]|nr:hypothetical protein ZWY2020_043761 [Hordeum vulgare]
MAPMAAESRLPLAAIVLVAITSTLLLAPPVSWDPNLVNACTWFHITCDDNKRVTRIDLNSLNLSDLWRRSLANWTSYNIFTRLSVLVLRFMPTFWSTYVSLAGFLKQQPLRPDSDIWAVSAIPRRSFANNPRLDRKC